MAQVFVSHTKKDEKFCDYFDRICAGVEIKRFRSEFEKIPRPAWKTIRDEMNKSSALFFLVGEELAKSQELNESDWRHTQNWISYEIGLACQKGIDVWVICDDVNINFPVPYLNNYLTVSLKHDEAFDYVREVLENYKKRRNYPFPRQYVAIYCPHENCKIGFNLHVRMPRGGKIRCPQCLGTMVFHKDHPID